jgi:hypothetical protein
VGPYDTVQLVPFQESTRPSVTPVELLVEVPMPTQLDELVQDTPYRASDPFSSGVVSIDQLVPFHNSTSICDVGHESTPEMTTHSTVPPTAIQLLELVHDTLRKEFSLYSGTAVDIIDQVAPFQDSARSWLGNSEAAPATEPTATQ